MSTANELLRRALEVLHFDLSAKESAKVAEEIRAFLAAEKEAEPLPSFLTEQEPLGEEFSRILDKHRWDLYERGGGECQLKPVEPEAEPVAWMFQHEDTGLIDFVDTQQVEWGFEKNNPRWQKISPIFLHQPRPEPARKPMKSEEMEKQYEIDKEYFGESVIRAFYNGIRFAEKHHGISE